MKRRLRKDIKELKKGYSVEELKGMSACIMKELEENEYFIKANTVALYWAMDDEVCTHEFVEKWADKKRILLPCIVGDDIEFRTFETKDKLKETGNYQIPEPEIGDVVTPEEIDLIIVPGVAFDIWGNRLGRGKGFYDRYLEKCSAYKIGVCFPFQYMEREIPTEVFDKKMDRVITK